MENFNPRNSTESVELTEKIKEEVRESEYFENLTEEDAINTLQNLLDSGELIKVLELREKYIEREVLRRHHYLLSDINSKLKGIGEKRLENAINSSSLEEISNLYTTFLRLNLFPDTSLAMKMAQLEIEENK